MSLSNDLQLEQMNIATDSHQSPRYSDDPQAQIDHNKQPQNSPQQDKNSDYNEFFDDPIGNKDDLMNEASESDEDDDEMKSIDLNQSNDHSKEARQVELGMSQPDVENRGSGEIIDDLVKSNESQKENEGSSLLGNDQKQEVIGMFRGYQVMVQQRIQQPETWTEILEKLFDFMQRPVILISILLVIVVMYLSAQNGAMERELNKMHHELDRFDKKENHLSSQMSSMSNVMSDVKKIEDDLVSKEKVLENKETVLEKKIEDDKQQEVNNFGPDQIEMAPFIPHIELMPPLIQQIELPSLIPQIELPPLITQMDPPKDLQDSLTDIRDRIHDSVLDLRKEVYGDQDESGKEEEPHSQMFKLEKKL